MAKFTYKGLPVVMPDGTKAVQPVRSIQDAGTGLFFKGVTGVDAQGNKFVYNKVPDDFQQELFGLLDANGDLLFDSGNNQLFVLG